MKTNPGAKEGRIFPSNDFTRRGLSLLLIFSFIATVISFTVAYCEHKNYKDLLLKYEESVSRISECEDSIAALVNTQTLVSKDPEITEPAASGKSEDVSASVSSEDTALVPSDEAESVSATTETPSGYYVTQSGKKYHLASCSYLNKSKIPISLERIKAEGYSPCSRCVKQ